MYVARVFSGRTIIHFTANKANDPKGMISKIAYSVGSIIRKSKNTIHFIPSGSNKEFLASGF